MANKNKKSFKESSQTSVASMFLSSQEPVADPMLEQNHQDVSYVPYVQVPLNSPIIEEPKMTRLNLKIDEKYKDYLEYISWQNRTSMTQYLIGLIKADMEKCEPVYKERDKNPQI